jgi:hypothetical protein
MVLPKIIALATNYNYMQTKHLFYPVVACLLSVFLIVPHGKIMAQEAINRRLNVAVNGFDFNETAAKKAIADGADINQKNDAMGGETLLIAAIKGFKESKVIKFLIDNGADKTIKDNSGKTALDWATQYKIGKNNNGREILQLLNNAPGTAATNQDNPFPKQKVTPVNPVTQNKTTPGGPSVNEIRQSIEKSLTKAYEDHFYGIKNKVSFEWIGGINVGQPENRLRPVRRCYSVKLNVKVTITDPRDGNTSALARGIEAVIGGYHKTEIFCFFKDGFGEWDYGTYEQ